MRNSAISQSSLEVPPCITIKIDARVQEAAIVLAEELHFGRVVQKLHIAVSMLSKKVAQLKEKLGPKLFERNSKGV